MQPKNSSYKATQEQFDRTRAMFDEENLELLAKQTRPSRRRLTVEAYILIAILVGLTAIVTILVT